MNKLYEQAQALRAAASKLEQEAEDLELPALQEKYKDLVGSCWEVKDHSGDDHWLEYYYVREIAAIHLNHGGHENVSLNCSRFSVNRPSWGLWYVGSDHAYLSILESYGKRITREKFNRKFVEFQEKIQI